MMSAATLRRLLVATLLLLLAPLAAQEKRLLDHDAYERWRRISTEHIAPNGMWVAWVTAPERGDDHLFLHHLTDGATRDWPRGTKPAFTRDSQYLLYQIAPPFATVRQAKLDKKKENEMPHDTLGIIYLATGVETRIPGLKSFHLAEEGADYVAYLLGELPADSAAADSNGADAEGGNGAGSKKDKRSGDSLVVRHLPSGREVGVGHVADYRFSRNGRWLAFTTETPDSSGDGVWAMVVGTGEVIPLLQGPGDYKALTFDREGRHLAFLSNRDHVSEKPVRYQLYWWPMDEAEVRPLAEAVAEGVPAGWGVSEHGDLAFSHDGKRLFFGSAPLPRAEPKDTLLTEEKVDVEIWHWRDPLLQSEQNEDLKAERNRSYAAVIDLKKKRAVQLADTLMPDLETVESGEGRWALGMSRLPYRMETSWDYPDYLDVYRVDLESGERYPVARKVQSRPRLSAGGRWIAWWDRDAREWMAARSDGDGEPRVLTASIDAPLHNEEHDWPYLPDAYGAAGWTAADRRFWIYDRHDIWAIDPSGKTAPRNLTGGVGRRDDLRFRLVDLDPEEPAIDADVPLLLATLDYATIDAGFQRLPAGGGAPTPLVMSAHDYSRPVKAKDGDRLLYTRESVSEFPDLWVTDPGFDNAVKISDVNPQQAEYRWATVELIDFHSLDGTPLKGMIYRPEDFDPVQQYPLMVYFYEKHHRGLHDHDAPFPHRSVINPIFYASRGYLVFIPDIPYRIGYPGESCYNAVMPGVTRLIESGSVDPARVGVQGHSWAGYQIAYLVTRTTLFRAAAGGAPVPNMISAYGGIRYGTGKSRMFQYERTQSRIGGTLWEMPLRYLENSPIFFADKIETPMLIMHNDRDHAVPFTQGVELFVALRRLGKPAWLVNYRGEVHWPQSYAERRDWQIRLQQYFDHYLKDAPAPVWMVEGIPALERERTLGLEPAGPGNEPSTAQPQE